MRVYKRMVRVVGVAFCVLLCFGLGGCSSRQAPESAQPERVGVSGDLPTASSELVGSFESEEQAQSAAELYGIELVSYEYEVAVFRYEGDPEALIEKGEKNGWPELSVNRPRRAMNK